VSRDPAALVTIFPFSLLIYVVAAMAQPDLVILEKKDR